MLIRKNSGKVNIIQWLFFIPSSLYGLKEHSVGMIKKSSGFTLIELMITIALVIILSTIAAPAFQSTVSGSQNESDLQALSNDLQFAKMAAYRQGREIKVCPSDTSLSAPSCSSSLTDWTKGWLVLDSTTNTVLRKGIPLSSSNLTGIYEGTNTTSSAGGSFLFETKGFVTLSPTTAFTYGYIASDQIRICVYMTGHIAKTTGSSC